MGCNSKISKKKIECCEFTQTYKYKVFEGFIYKNGIKHAKVIMATKNENENLTSITAETISKNKYLNRKIIYMTMNSEFYCV